MQAQKITAIYNNTDHDIYLWTHEDPLVGAVPIGTFYPPPQPPPIAIDKDGVLHIPKQTGVSVAINIPPYKIEKADGVSYLAIAPSKPGNPKAYSGGQNALLLWTAKMDGEAGITFVDAKTMRGIYHMAFEKDYENLYALFFSVDKDDEKSLDVQLELRASNALKHWFLNLLKQRRAEHEEEVAELRKEAGKAMLALL